MERITILVTDKAPSHPNEKKQRSGTPLTFLPPIPRPRCHWNCKEKIMRTSSLTEVNGGGKMLKNLNKTNPIDVYWTAKASKNTIVIVGKVTWRKTNWRHTDKENSKKKVVKITLLLYNLHQAINKEMPESTLRTDNKAHLLSHVDNEHFSDNKGAQSVNGVRYSGGMNPETTWYSVDTGITLP